MVHPDSHRISRVPRYSGIPTIEKTHFRLQDWHLLWLALQCYSANMFFYDSMETVDNLPLAPTTPKRQRIYPLTSFRFRLFPVRSPLLRKSQLISLPLGTMMVHFPRFAPAKRVTQYESSRVSPFGHPRIKAYLQLPEAFRSSLRPSSPLCAKASAIYP